jgi:glycine oxidase
LLENCKINEILLVNNRATSLETSIGKLSIKELIITAGAWTSEVIDKLFPTMRADKPHITPVKGQMLLFKAKPETLTKIVLDGDHYLIPRLDGHILAGSTVESESFDKTPTADAKNLINSFAFKLLPALADYPLVKHWAGIRPGTQNGVPYIDRHCEISNLSINSGHFRNGLAMAPASAQLMVDLILGRPTSVDPEPYRLNRLI